jgi:hypothetical protein
MARRKSGWQQFADNFNSVYDAGTKYAKDAAFRDLDGRTLEEQLDDDGNLTGYTYGDTVYNSKDDKGGLIRPTDDKLRLQNIMDTQKIMRKFGDHKGAMDMGLKYADLEARNEENRINRSIRDHLIYQKGEGKTNELNAGIGGTNASTANMTANTNRTNTLLPGEVSQQEATLDSTGASTANMTANTNRTNTLLPGEVSQQEATLDSTNTSTGLNKVKLKTEEEIQESDSANKVAENVNKKTKTDINQIRNNSILEVEKGIADGSIKGFDQIKAKMIMLADKTGDKDIAKRLAGMNERQLSEAMFKGKKLRADAEAALATGTPDAIVELIDSRDGIEGNLKLQTAEDGSFRLIQLTEDGYVDETAPVISGDDWADFGANVMKTLNPLAAIDISMNQAKVDNMTADTGLKHGKTSELKGATIRALSKAKADRRAAFMSSTAYATIAADPNVSESTIRAAFEKWVEGQGNDDLSGFKLVN